MSVASAYADLQQHRSEGIHRKPSPVSSYVPPPDYLEENEDDDLIKPKKLVNPVKASKSHQELHRELMSSYKRYKSIRGRQGTLRSVQGEGIYKDITAKWGLRQKLPQWGHRQTQ